MRTSKPRYGTPSIIALTLGFFEPNAASTSNGTSTNAPPPPAFWMTALKVFLVMICSFLQVSRNEIFPTDPRANHCTENRKQEAGEYGCFKAAHHERIKHGHTFR